jgi:hypothetical protein
LNNIKWYNVIIFSILIVASVIVTTDATCTTLRSNSMNSCDGYEINVDDAMIGHMEAASL